jgi:ATP-binding cassette subfamily B multidrug efflux pump
MLTHLHRLHPRKNAPELVLDETASTLEIELDQVIQQAYDRILQGQTTIVIGRRPSTIRNAKFIRVI